MPITSTTIEPGRRVIVNGFVSAQNYQRATVDLRDQSERKIAETTFVGRGDNVPLVQEANPASSSWSLGPFKEPHVLNVLIENSKPEANNFTPSKVISPVNVNNAANSSAPANYLLSTLLSEDGTDDDYTDCVLNIFQYQ
ncbi:hypothetical protein H0H92_000292 [Tricholoma furcatifolium]|nr:hypothetical protein H0H92_000292 [Tricholoma furcatifolium]